MVIAGPSSQSALIVGKATGVRASTKRGARLYFYRNWQLYAMLLLPMAYFVLFKYGPLYGILIAFKNYNPFQGVLRSPWVGLQVFQQVFQSGLFVQALRNTLMLNFLDLIFSFPAPIIMAILLNEIRLRWFKKASQTVVYFPHFISWVIIGGIAIQVFANNGIVNQVLGLVSIHPVSWLLNPFPWLAVYLGAGLWQSFGWGTIIYLAAITAINQDLYEAADVDGAGRWTKVWKITLPSLKPTIMILLILNLGNMIQIGFDRPFILGNVSVLNFSQVLSTYVYQTGLQQGEFSIATAVGLFQAVVGVVLILGANYMSKRFADQSIL